MPSGKNAWLTFLTFDLLIKIVILHALLAVSMTNILLVNFNFNGVTVRVTCTTKSSKIQLQGGGETCACFLYRSLIPGSPHSQDLGRGGDRLSL